MWALCFPVLALKGLELFLMQLSFYAESTVSEKKKCKKETFMWGTFLFKGNWML